MTTDIAAFARYLEIFPAWLGSLGEDARALGRVLGETTNDEVGRYVASGLNYIFKSLDLIPDGIDDLGYCDDAFVIRVAAALACEADEAAAGDDVLGRLSNEAKDVEAFLGDDYASLVTYVKALRKGAARGRTVDEIMTDAEVRATFLQEVAAWAHEYQVPTFTQDKKTLIKLKAFLGAKLS